MVDEQIAFDELGRYWDALSAGGSPAGGDLDPELLAAVRHLQELGTAPPAGSARARVWDQIVSRIEAEYGATAQFGTDTAALALDEPTFAPNGRADTRPIGSPASPPRPGRGRWAAQLAMAALLLLTLVAGLLLLRVVRPGFADPPVPFVETLLDATIETGGTPGKWVPITLERWIFAPGPAALTVAPLDGVQWVAADAGTLVATVNGQERELEPGTALMVEAGQELALRNAGTGEAAAFRGVVSVAFANEVYDRAAIGQQIVLDTAAAKAVPVGASRLVFVRVTLPLGGALPPAATGELDWFGVVAGRLGLTLHGARLPVGWKGGVEREVAALERLPRLVPGTEATLRNIGEEPLVVLRLTVLPIDQVTGETGEVAAVSAAASVALSLTAGATEATRHDGLLLPEG